MLFFALTILVFAVHIIGQRRGAKARRQEA
jgi:hypothetical protein